MNFKNEFRQKINLIEENLRKYVYKKDNPQSLIYDCMSYSLFAGGKRIRPVLSLAVHDMFNNNSDEILPFACAIEMIHTYSLIHDDLPCMDDDDFRRGKPSNHKKNGEAAALLAGDALLNTAYETMISEAIFTNIDKVKALRAINVIAEAAGTEGMIGGQVVDMFCSNDIINQEQLEYMHLHKTGAIIKAAASIGAIVGGAADREIKAIEKYSLNLGLAFQVKDDILDVIGKKDKIGKPVGSDMVNKKNTYVTLKGIEESKKLVKKLTEDAIESLSIFGEKANFLIELANYLLVREY